MSRNHVDTVVIGGSQAGLAVGYYLQRHRSSAYPSKDEVADYLETYAREFALPIRTGVKVDRLSAAGDRFQVLCRGEELSAENVVVATGAFHHPRVPGFAAGLSRNIVQLHSSAYRNRSQLREGGGFVVGAGNSGAEIALEIAAHHRTWLSGPDTGQEPTRAGSVPDRLFTPIIWLMATRLTVKTLPGRKLRDHFLDPPRGHSPGPRAPQGHQGRRYRARRENHRRARWSSVARRRTASRRGQRHLVHGLHV